MKSFPQFTGATSLGNMCLNVHFEGGWSAELDLSEFVAGFKSLKPLRDADLFPRVALEEWGSGLTWDEEGPLSIAATTVYRLAVEQSNDRARSFDAWMMRHGFSASKAADTLGISPRWSRARGDIAFANRIDGAAVNYQTLNPMHSTAALCPKRNFRPSK